MPNCHRPLPSLMTSFFLRRADAAAFRSTDVHGMTCCRPLCRSGLFQFSRGGARSAPLPAPRPGRQHSHALGRTAPLTARRASASGCRLWDWRDRPPAYFDVAAAATAARRVAWRSPTSSLRPHKFPPAVSRNLVNSAGLNGCAPESAESPRPSGRDSLRAFRTRSHGRKSGAGLPCPGQLRGRHRRIAFSSRVPVAMP